MAPSNDESNEHRAQDNTTNPFIAFRRFADEQMSTLFNSVFGLNAPFGSSSSHECSAKDYQMWLQEARQSRDRLDREAEEMGKILDVYARAYHEQRAPSPPNDDIQESKNDDAAPPRCPYRPIEEDMPTHPQPSAASAISRYHYDFPLGVALPHEFPNMPTFGRQIDSFPVAYLIFSPYSPARLKESQALRNRGICWREAFEDLLAVQSGQDVRIDSSYQAGASGVDRVWEMVGTAMREEERNMLRRQKASYSMSEDIRRRPGYLDRFANSRQPESDTAEDGEKPLVPWTSEGTASRLNRFTDSRKPERDANEDDEDDEDEFGEDDDDDNQEDFTELDLYGRFLGFGNHGPASDSITSVMDKSLLPHCAPIGQDSVSTEDYGNKPSILSTLTTTERTTLQDGTVHTKVVLKKKFSDGREESTETVHTQNTVAQTQAEKVAKKVDKDEHKNESQEERNEKSRGWFWS